MDADVKVEPLDYYNNCCENIAYSSDFASISSASTQLENKVNIKREPEDDYCAFDQAGVDIKVKRENPAFHADSIQGDDFVSENETVDDAVESDKGKGITLETSEDERSIDSNKSLSYQVYPSQVVLRTSHANLNEDEEETCKLCNRHLTFCVCFGSQNSIDQVKDRHVCAICGATFTQNYRLQTHLRTHSGEKPYRCDVCWTSFNHSGSLTIHMRTHTGERPYKCDTCQSGFSSSSHLKVHRRSHTGEKPYRCPFCESAFAQVFNLRRHTRTHTGEKPFTCELCNFAFSRRAHLKRHMRIHTGEKPFKCDICPSAFSRTSHLTQHIKSHVD